MPRVRPIAIARSPSARCSAAPVAGAQKEPRCPGRDLPLPGRRRSTAIDCFLNAVEHLYTMCRQVKSIEIIEFGYEKADEGVNGAKSEYCVDKHKQSIARPYQAALREAGGSRGVVEACASSSDSWLEVAGRPQVAARRDGRGVQGPHRAALRVFSEQVDAVRVAHGAGPAKPAPAPKPTRAAKPKARRRPSPRLSRPRAELSARASPNRRAPTRHRPPDPRSPPIFGDAGALAARAARLPLPHAAARDGRRRRAARSPRARR